MTLEMGKAVAESRAEIAYAAEFFRWFSEEAVRIHGRYMVNTTGKGRHPHDAPAGGPVRVRHALELPHRDGHAQDRPRDRRGLHDGRQARPADAAVDARAGADPRARPGCPAGVLNVITAKRSGAVIEPLLKDPRTRKLSFTGSTEVGRTLIEQSAEQVLRVSMELGGNAPFLVFEDADLDAAVEGAMLAKMRNVGEACTAANRFHVHESVAEEFAARLAERMGALKVGRGTEPGRRRRAR